MTLKQWLRIYSQSIELAGGDDDIKALFFPMALEAMSLQWFDKLNPGSIRGWEDLQRAFYDNFAGIITVTPRCYACISSCKT
jgi:hypothetical protein